jgi:hypothetical protein
MPRPKPSAFAGSADVHAMVERVAPAILGLLADGVPRTKAAIVEALAERHHRTDILHTLIRLVAAGTVIKTGSEYTQAVAVSEPDAA